MADLFRKNMEKRCAYCAHGVRISEHEIACERRGIMDEAAHCRRFSYDPLKRVPPRPATLRKDQYNVEDFTL